jgi:hypothetical protein
LASGQRILAGVIDIGSAGMIGMIMSPVIFRFRIGTWPFARRRFLRSRRHSARVARELGKGIVLPDQSRKFRKRIAALPARCNAPPGRFSCAILWVVIVVCHTFVPVPA